MHINIQILQSLTIDQLYNEFNPFEVIELGELLPTIKDQACIPVRYLNVLARICRETERRTLIAKVKTTSGRISNRMLYTPHPIFNLYRTEEGLVRIHGDLSLRSGGLAELVSNDRWPNYPEPSAISFLNLLSDDDNDDVFLKDSIWDNVNDLLMAVSKEKLGWNTNHPAYKLIAKCFPNAVNFSAYNHSLNAPILPKGFFPNIEVICKTLTDEHGEDLGFDGSGWYHPEHPRVADFVKQYGIVPMQIRFINTMGVFMKGMLFPSDTAVHNEQPAILFDWDQIKGKWKPLAQARRKIGETKTITGYLGVIQTWSRPTKLKAGFQVLENIEVCDRSSELIAKAVNKSVARLEKLGVDGLIDQAVKDDVDLKLMVDLMRKMKKQGLDVTPTQIPRVHAAVDDLLCRTKYHLATGAGVAFDQYVVQMDNTVPRGHCLIYGIRPGTKLVLFRFPMILSQGLVTLEVCEPTRPHQLANGKLGKYTIHLNPYDIVIQMQGDSDGDFVGISTDPDMVELFSHLIDDNIYHIESDHVIKLDIPVASKKGLGYMRWDQQGPIGLLTRWRTYLLACGDKAGAISMSMLGQQAIDKAKKIPKWFDYKMAANPGNWRVEEDGWHFDHLLDADEIQDGDLDLPKVADWVRARVEETLGLEGQEFELPQLAQWISKTKSLRDGEWKAVIPNSLCSNMVHLCNDYALHRYNQVKDQFKLDAPIINMEDILPAMLGLMGHDIPFERMEWINYRNTIRQDSGITQFGQQFATVLDKQRNDEWASDLCALVIRQITKELHNSLQAIALKEDGLSTLMTIWWNEIHHEGHKMGNVNHAFRAIAWEGSPILEMCGIPMPETCGFMDKTYNIGGQQLTRTEKATRFLLKKEHTHQELAELIHTDAEHLKDIGTPLDDCTHCVKQLTDSVIGAVRAKRSRVEYEYLRAWVGACNPGLKALS